MKKDRQLFLTVLVTFLILMTSCCSMKQFSPPYLVTEQYVRIGQEGQSYMVAGAHFTLFNNSDKTMTKFTLSFRLYDSDGELSGIGTNCLVSNYEGVVLPHKEAKVIVSLDSAVGSELKDAYQIDYVYVTSITYSDGSVWTDPLGLYAW